MMTTNGNPKGWGEESGTGNEEGKIGIQAKYRP